MTYQYRERKIVKFNENLHAVKLSTSGERLDANVPPSYDVNGTLIPSSSSQLSKNQMPSGNSLLPQQSEQLKRELLGKQLGRAPSSISGPELDAFQFIKWTDLPPCPIHGMNLTEKGLYDTDIGRYLEIDDVRD